MIESLRRCNLVFCHATMSDSPPSQPSIWPVSSRDSKRMAVAASESSSGVTRTSIHLTYRLRSKLLPSAAFVSNAWLCKTFFNVRRWCSSFSTILYHTATVLVPPRCLQLRLCLDLKITLARFEALVLSLTITFEQILIPNSIYRYLQATFTSLMRPLFAVNTGLNSSALTLRHSMR